MQIVTLLHYVLNMPNIYEQSLEDISTMFPLYRLGLTPLWISNRLGLLFPFKTNNLAQFLYWIAFTKQRFWKCNGFSITFKQPSQNFKTCINSQSINIQWRIHDMIEIINNYFMKASQFSLDKRETSNQKDTSGRWKRWVLVRNILQKCLVERSFW